ncbi:GSCOCG00005408001-RA-CDS [Cotesia congregata]|nr:GSCOCG00005408001-RA-CDS [Cotesia congregata]
MLNLFSIFLLKIFSIVTILNLHDASVVATSMDRLKRFNGVQQWYYLWPEGRIPYIIDSSSFGGPERRLMKQAMREWERSTCIKFIDRQNFIIHPDYVYITKSNAEVLHQWRWQKSCR